MLSANVFVQWVYPRGCRPTAALRPTFAPQLARTCRLRVVVYEKCLPGQRGVVHEQKAPFHLLKVWRAPVGPGERGGLRCRNFQQPHATLFGEGVGLSSSVQFPNPSTHNFYLSNEPCVPCQTLVGCSHGAMCWAKEGANTWILRPG